MGSVGSLAAFEPGRITGKASILMHSRILVFVLARFLFFAEASYAESEVIPQSELQAIVGNVRIESSLIALSVGIVDPDGLTAIAVSGVRRRGDEDLVKAMTAALVALFVERGAP